LKAWQQANGEQPTGKVLVNSCSFGGTNFSIVLAPYSDSGKG
jgi:hypothetical protein